MRTLLREAESRRIQAEAKAKRAERNAAATTVELDALRADCTPHKRFRAVVFEPIWVCKNL